MPVTTRPSAPLVWTLTSSLPQGSENNRDNRVYLDFYNLKDTPFAITPDPEFLFLSETHRNVIEKLRYAIGTRMGFMLLTGEVGTGKTTLCRALLDQMQARLQTVYVINPALSGHELLANILDDLGVAYPVQASKKELIDRLNRFLLENQAKGPVVIIVDDAQTMPLATLEDLRLLSNLETDKTKLLQMLLVGQPELLDLLDRPEIRQLKQRVAVHCRLDFLSCAEVGGYIDWRLFVAGNQGQVRFTPQVVKQIHKRSGGVPRIINKISDLAMTAAYTTNSQVVKSTHFKAACSELIEGRNRWPRFFAAWHRWRAALIAVVSVITVMAVGYGTRAGFHPWHFSRPVPDASMLPSSLKAVRTVSREPIAGNTAAENVPAPAAALEPYLPEPPVSSTGSGRSAVEPGDPP
jgi:type II secretory pathway predicted ATPase ExeA